MSGEFYGHPTESIQNAHLRLEFLAQAGPRIIGLFVAGSDDNMLAELPEEHIDTPIGQFNMFGGHRLWHSPEAMPRTYISDEEGLTIEAIEEGVRLVQPIEKYTNIQKTLEIQLHPGKAAVTLTHYLKNEGLWPVELAIWAITQLPLGGVGIMPQTVGPLDEAGLLPNRTLVLWPYTRWDDPRLHLHDDFILIPAQPIHQACKIGYANRAGWTGYLNKGIFFVKHFNPQLDRPHPDFGCNVEYYCNHRFIEMETLSPLTILDAGESVSHKETWEFFPEIDAPPTIAGARQLVESLSLKVG